MRRVNSHKAAKTVFSFCLCVRLRMERRSLCKVLMTMDYPSIV